MPTEIITREDLQNFKQELLEDLKLILKTQPENKKLLKSQDVRKMLSISAGTLQTLRINGTLPYTKVGGTIYYQMEDVTKILEDNKHPGK